MAMAHCPALWSVAAMLWSVAAMLWSVAAMPAHSLFLRCGAGGSMMNVHGRDGTSDGAGHLRLGTVLAVASLLVGA
jgi:hypothetical protein